MILSIKYFSPLYVDIAFLNRNLHIMDKKRGKADKICNN